MKDVAVNPYLPGWEYVPDGEPHVFGDRVYVFGSHDRVGGTAFCERDYTIWSAPVDDLGNWHCHGVSYRKDQDPHNQKAKKELWAPDVCQGTDGRYYMYYCCAFVPEIGIAVSDVPGGPYEFYDYVRDEDGNIWHQDMPFDPGILFEDKDHIWLYSGFGPDPTPLYTKDMLRQMPPFKDASEAELDAMAKQAEILHNPSEGSNCLRLAPDMKTVLKRTVIAPSRQNAAGTSFAKHPFFQASSIRKINDTYYFVYSSFQGHELCYATSKYPDHDFEFGGVIISNADLGYHGNQKPRADYANNHGGMVQINGQWYIFYHRHTHGTPFSRQGCAEPIQILPDGSIPQVEMTSCGLNGGPLPAHHSYSAHICCNLMGPEGGMRIDDASKGKQTCYIDEEGTGTEHVNDFIHHMTNGYVAGVKYLAFNGENKVRLTLRGHGQMAVLLDSEDAEPIAIVDVNAQSWTDVDAKLAALDGKHAVYFKALGEDAVLDFSEFAFSK